MTDSAETLERGRPREFVQGLERGLMVLSALTAVARGRTIAQAARDTGLTRAVARRYLFTLRSLGYAVQVGDRFRVTHRLLDLGLSGRPSIEIGAHIEPALRDVLRLVGDRGTAAFSLLDGHEAVVVAARGEAGMLLEAGLRRPAAGSAAGHVLLGSMEPEDWSNPNFRPRTSDLLSDAHLQLIAEVEAVARAGFAESGSPAQSGRLEMAVPVRDPDGVILAALEVSIPTQDEAADRELALGALRGTASGVSAAICV